MFPECNLLNNSDYTYYESRTIPKRGNGGYQFIANTNVSGGGRGDDDTKSWSGNCVGIERCRTFAIPYLVLNPNSHIFTSLIFYLDHAVPPRTKLYVFRMFIFLLNIPNFKFFLYILMPLLNFILHWHFKGEKKPKLK